jgi:hypothetical protein
MNLLLLGGIGGVSLDASRDLIHGGGFDHVLLADVDLERARQLGLEMGLAPEQIARIDASDRAALVELMRGFDVVMNGLPKLLAPNVLRSAIEVGCHVADLGSPTADLEQYDREAREARITYLAGCGATPGITNMMALLGARQLETVEEINIHFAAFRLWPFASLDPRCSVGSIHCANATYYRVVSQRSPFVVRKWRNFRIRLVSRQCTSFRTARHVPCLATSTRSASSLVAVSRHASCASCA